MYKSTVVVTHYTGFLGSYLCEGLLKEKMIDNLLNGRRATISKAKKFFNWGPKIERKESLAVCER